MSENAGLVVKFTMNQLEKVHRDILPALRAPESGSSVSRVKMRLF
jgi:hypothetical protein